MNNKGQLMPPFFKWIFGVVMLFTILMIFQYFQPLIEYDLPGMFANAPSTPQADETVGYFADNWKLAMVALAVGFGIYLFLSGFGGQTEEITWG